MIQHVGEAIVLRTWPFQEADLLVSLFTREQGRVKGVARHALRSRRRFGGALEMVAEVLEEALPEGAPEDAVFRLTLAVIDELQVGRVWMPVTYFALWMNRLLGWMPELGRCSGCGRALVGEAGWYSAASDGVTCADDRKA